MRPSASNSTPPVSALNRRTFLAGAAAWLAEASAGANPPADEVPLFDGRSLQGWHKNRKRIGHGTGGRWTVRDDAIVGEQQPPGNGGLLLTDQTYADFDLSLDICPDWGIDSGLFVRSTPDGKAFQIAVDHFRGGYVGQIYGEGIGGFNTRTFGIEPHVDDEGRIVALGARPRRLDATAGVLHAIEADDWALAWRWGAWNLLRVRVVGHLPRITAWLNGVKTIDVDFERFEHERFDARAVRDALRPTGHIALQIHGGTQRWAEGAACRWRNVRLQPLTGPAPDDTRS